jgi:hypothetical protein
MNLSQIDLAVRPVFVLFQRRDGGYRKRDRSRKRRREAAFATRRRIAILVARLLPEGRIQEK